MNKDSILKGVLLCTIAGVSFGGQWPIAGTALKVIDPFYFTLIRYLIVAVVLVGVLVIVEGKEKLKFEGKAFILWFFGTMAFTIYNFLVFVGQKMIGAKGAIIGSIMMALIPMVSVLVLWVYKKNRPPLFTLASVAVAFVGVLMVITKGDSSFFTVNKEQILPIFFMLISVFSWVIYTIGGSSFPGWSPLRYTTLSCLLGNISSLVIIVFATMFGYIHVPLFTDIVGIGWEMFYMSIVAGVIGVYTWNGGNKILTPINGSLFINLVPIVTFIISALNGYKISQVELIGSVITILALCANNLYQRTLKSTCVNANVETCK